MSELEELCVYMYVYTGAFTRKQITIENKIFIILDLNDQEIIIIQALLQ